jgi:hypothetical protein
MNWGLILSLGIGVGWVIGVTISMILTQLSGIIPYQTFLDSLGNTFIFSCPGIVLFVVSIILAIRDDMDKERYG